MRVNPLLRPKVQPQQQTRTHSNNTVAGRDKVLQLLQYTARFLAWHSHRANYAQDTVDRFTVVKQKLILARKLWRVGRFLDQINAVYLSNAKHAYSLLAHYLTIGRQVSLASYLLIDTITAVDAVGLKKLPHMVRLGRLCNQLWATGLFFGISNGIYRVVEMLRSRRVAASGPGEEKEGDQVNGHVHSAKDSRGLVPPAIPISASEQRDIVLQLVADILDFTVATAGFDLHNLSEGFVSAAGVQSSLIGFFFLWRDSA